ncbi:MAG: hypothetical protein AMJ93_08790 [Anaerolineae bacterium SM23_84]|jgi:KaiC/GvpD/RAD55 family RecA-like ATPase|nr:MAG: hypothetical protein AMJ93_08790 [Anaerolineae bacterium SM23_84]
MESFKEYQEYNHEGIAALFLITTDRSPHELARDVAEFNWDEEAPWGLRVFGVQWTAVLVDSYNVVAAVRVKTDDDLDKLQQQIEDAGGTVNPSAQILTDFFKVRRGQNGGF